MKREWNKQAYNNDNAHEVNGENITSWQMVLFIVNGED